MLRLLPAGLRQLWVVVGDIKPFRLPALIGVNEFVRQVLLDDVFMHLNVGSSDYSWVVGARLWLHMEEFLEQYPVGFDSHEGFAEVNCDNPPRKVPYYRLRPIHFGH
jgi:hypothetical protein